MAVLGAWRCRVGETCLGSRAGFGRSGAARLPFLKKESGGEMGLRTVCSTRTMEGEECWKMRPWGLARCWVFEDCETVC